GDVALLAVQLDELLASIAPDVPREPRRVASIASVNPSPAPLGRAIVQTFRPLTRDVLLVVDEWEAAGTAEAEQLLSLLVEGLDIRFLITSRARPEWLAPRLEVYGEALEIGADELAMTDEEAAEVLAAAGAVAGRARLMRTANGWPAVLGLAAMSGDVDFTASRLLSHTLYEFLAGELLAGAGAETQEALLLLAVASVQDVEGASLLLGERSDELLDDAVARGLLAITERTLSLHPLLRELLLRRFAAAAASSRARILSRCRALFAGRRWDEALCVAEAARDPRFVADALGAALDDLLAAGRTSSLERWVAAARAAGADGGLIDYAESELLLRRAELDRARALASQAARSLSGDLAARSHLVAGRAAHLADRPRSAQAHAEAAAAVAKGPDSREGALWLLFLAGVEPQASDLRERLDQFEGSARAGVQQSLMTAAGELTIAEIDGDLEQAIDDARCALSLATGATDPIAHTGLLSTYSYALILTCRYRESLRHLDELTRIAETCGVEFPLRYAAIYRAKALVGLRKFGLAERTLAGLERELEDQPGSYVRANLPLQRARLYASLGDLERALDALALGPPEPASIAGRAEFLGLQALLRAAAGAPAEARALAAEARSLSRGLEARALSLLAEAVAALGDGDRRTAIERTERAIESAVWDPLVIALRAAPELGELLANEPGRRGWLQRLLTASSDTALARALGLQVPRAARARGSLSPREREVHELLAQGLTNEEIAKRLYISLSTTKVHVKHIYEKLGVRSRLEAARALREDV
ncbi:MAG TPA: LuxR C-terminal-related transcriptional regulator, partial [Gaiellaceae bacterium]|nr:LuxR C-terminal-related transcriptional regulator [Gaiellaceae bacterium]